jgi:MFS transporter, SP family, general alpha glucoside:H+ symporter
MIGGIGVIFAFLPETPWYLASKGKVDEASRVLNMFHKNVEGYDVQEQIVSLMSHCTLWADLCSDLLKWIYYSSPTRQEVMTTTVAVERQKAEDNKELGTWAVFRGRNLVRFIIAGWPKIAQQFVGLSVFNTYATYFCKLLWLQAVCVRGAFC